MKYLSLVLLLSLISAPVLAMEQGVEQQSEDPYVFFLNTDISDHPKLLFNIEQTLNYADEILNRPVERAPLTISVDKKMRELLQILQDPKQHLDPIIDNPYARPRDKTQAQKLLTRLGKRDYARVLTFNFNDQEDSREDMQAAPESAQQVEDEDKENL